jgi:biotin carboxyl carrier protein
MPKYELIARVDTDADEDGSFLVRSPAVGVADGVPPEGAYLNPLAGFLTLSVLHRRHLVRLPRNVQGRVTERLIEDTLTPVGFDQPLFRLSQVAEASGEAAGGAGTVGHAAAGATATDPASTDLIAITAPSEGVFYRRPSPDAPPYVEAGAEVTTGTVLGLVEVMKSFNQITYGGTGLPERGTVIEVLVDDTAEVAFGQRLFLIRPA